MDIEVCRLYNNYFMYKNKYRVVYLVDLALKRYFKTNVRCQFEDECNKVKWLSPLGARLCGNVEWFTLNEANHRMKTGSIEVEVP